VKLWRRCSGHGAIAEKDGTVVAARSGQAGKVSKNIDDEATSAMGGMEK